MTDEQIALARRAVACKGFRWLPGMKVLDGFRVVESVVPMMFPVDTPDLTDPATLGCLLALVREVWGKPAVLMFWGDYWQVVYTSDVEDGCAGHEHIGDGDTEAEALANALENAP